MFHRPLEVTNTFPGILQAQKCIDICTNSAKTLAQINTMVQDYIIIFAPMQSQGKKDPVSFKNIFMKQ